VQYHVIVSYIDMLQLGSGRCFSAQIALQSIRRLYCTASLSISAAPSIRIVEFIEVESSILSSKISHTVCGWDDE